VVVSSKNSFQERRVFRKGKNGKFLEVRGRDQETESWGGEIEIPAVQETLPGNVLRLCLIWGVPAGDWEKGE